MLVGCIIVPLVLVILVSHGRCVRVTSDSVDSLSYVEPEFDVLITLW